MLIVNGIQDHIRTHAFVALISKARHLTLLKILIVLHPSDFVIWLCLMQKRWLIHKQKWQTFLQRITVLQINSNNYIESLVEKRRYSFLHQ